MPSIELQTAVIKAAHGHGLMTAAHATTLEDTLAILKAGVDGLAHTFSDTYPTPELIEAYKANNSFLIPTLLVHGSLSGEGAPIAASFANDPRAQGKIADAEKANMCACMHIGAGRCKVENAYESVRQLKAAGIDILWYSSYSIVTHVDRLISTSIKWLRCRQSCRRHSLGTLDAPGALPLCAPRRLHPAGSPSRGHEPERETVRFQRSRIDCPGPQSGSGAY